MNASDDSRLTEFWRAFPDARRILELGAFEGSHSFALAAAHPGVHVTAVEARDANLRRARRAQRRAGPAGRRVTFVRADVEVVRPPVLGGFDAVFCCGLLYHLTRPWGLLDTLAAAAPGAFIWSHYAAEGEATHGVDGSTGAWRPDGSNDLGGLESRSFWLTRDALLGRLADAGFATVEAVAEDANHPNGPSITIAARV